MDSGASGDNAFWFSDAQGTLNGFGLDLDGPTAKLFYHNTGASAPAIASTSSTVLYNTYLVLRGSGAFAFIKGGVFTNPTLLFSDTTLDSSAKYVVLSNGRAANCFFGPILVPKTLWLPQPIASDSFVRANGALGVTDGNGTQEKNGGAGLTWNAPGWVISGNTAIAGNTVVADGVTSGLVGRWQLDTATGATDLSGNGNNGTGQGGISIGAATDRRGMANRATSFDGSSQYISASPYDFSGVNNWSVSAWVYILNFTAPHNNPVFVTQVLNSDQTDRQMWLSGSPSLLAIQRAKGGVYDTASFTTTVPTALWFHLVGTYDGIKLRLYYNGALVATQDSSQSVNANDRFGIGHNINTGVQYWLGGSEADIRVYNRAISASEVKRIYLAGSTALCTNSTANVVADTSFTGSTSPSGVVLNYDGATGTNLLTSYFDGNGNVKVDQVVNGNATNLISGAVTYVANARLLTVSAPSEGQVRVYYNNSFVNSSTGIWPGFTNFTQHGLYSQGSGSFTNFANFARGTEGQYSIIDTLK